MESGIIIKGVGGFYNVYTGEGRIVTCVARGKIKNKGIKLFVGDRVSFSCSEAGTGIIETVFPRTRFLHRPPVANINQLILVFAMNKPRLNLNLLDKLLVQAEAASLPALIVINKIDLGFDREAGDIKAIYTKIGYKVLPVSALKNQGVAEMKPWLKERISVVAGPSGTGKSTLINRLCPGADLKTREVSAKLKRGRHTTRHVELIPLEGGGFIADTPGFSFYQLKDIGAAELAGYFPEIKAVRGGCKFGGCLHDREPECEVLCRMNRGEITRSRYDSYLQLLREVQSLERSF
ncbi:MAG TPA: ribosome small subunit-dependent GTPase A [Firmicutes bacterium]|nr:ribosome small subunit-dependent GTPase A [Bacillota bacterium]